MLKRKGNAHNLHCSLRFHYHVEGEEPAKQYKPLKKDSLTFGEVFESYVYHKVKERNHIAIKGVKVFYMNISGKADIVIPGEAVLEVKYSTIASTQELIQYAKRQAVFYALALGLNKSVIVAGNPLENEVGKIVFHEITKEEFIKTRDEIINIASGKKREPEKGHWCGFCPYKKKCPLFQKM